MRLASLMLFLAYVSMILAGCMAPQGPIQDDGQDRKLTPESSPPDDGDDVAKNGTGRPNEPAPTPTDKPEAQTPANEAHRDAMNLSDPTWVIDRFALYQSAGTHDVLRDKDERPNPMTPWLLVIEARSEEDGDRRFCWGWDDQYECEWFDTSKPLKLYRRPNSAGYMAVGDHVVFGGAQWTAVTVYPVPGIGERIEIPGMAAITLESYDYDTRQGTLLIVPNGTASYHASNRHGSSCSTTSDTVEELPEGRRLHFWCDETSDGSQHILLRYFDNDKSRAIWAFRWTIDPPA